MNRITKTFTFAASHQLDFLPEGHKCARLHGHNYEVDLILSGRLDDAGMVLDYGQLDSFAGFVRAMVDHRHLNDVVDFNPTAERLARWLHTQAHDILDMPPGVHLDAVRVRETPKTQAEYIA